MSEHLSIQGRLNLEGEGGEHFVDSGVQTKFQCLLLTHLMH